MKKTFSAFEILKSAWQLFLIHKKFYLKTVLIFGGIAFIADMLMEDGSGRMVDIVLSIISTVASWYGTIVLMKASLAVSKNQPISENVMSLSWPLVLTLVFSSFLVGFGTVIGTLLLIIPGIIFAIRASLTQYVILSEGTKSIASIKKSMALTKGYFWSFFRFFLCICVLAFVSVFPLIGLGFIILVPVSTIAFSLIYHRLQTEPVVEVITQV